MENVDLFNVLILFELLFIDLILPLNGPNQYFVFPQIFSAYNAGTKIVKVRLVIFVDVKVLKLVQAVAN